MVRFFEVAFTDIAGALVPLLDQRRGSRPPVFISLIDMRRLLAPRIGAGDESEKYHSQIRPVKPGATLARLLLFICPAGQDAGGRDASTTRRVLPPPNDQETTMQPSELIFMTDLSIHVGFIAGLGADLGCGPAPTQRGNRMVILSSDAPEWAMVATKPLESERRARAIDTLWAAS